MGRLFYWMLMPYRRYADFTGRSQRMEYWLFMLFYWVATVVLVSVMMAGLPWDAMDATRNGASASTVPAPIPGPLLWAGAGLWGLFALVSLIPSWAVTVRRFHDQEKSGWLILLNFVPYVGFLVVLVFMCLEGTRGPNRYGDDPTDPHSAEIFA